MLPLKHRLSKKSDFERVFRRGRFISGRYFFLKYTSNPFKKARVGFIISKKVSNRAVIRNRLARQARAVIARYYAHLCLGRDIVFIAQPAATAIQFSLVKSEIENLLQQARLLEPRSRDCHKA